MKKLVAILLSAVMLSALLAGCSKTDDNQDTANDTDTTTETAADETAEEADDASEGTGDIQGPDDLEGKTIGVQLGTTGDLYTSDDFGDENIERYSKGFEAVQALLQGKVDAVVIDDQPAKVFVEQNEGLKILEAEYVEEDYAMCIAQDNEELKEQFNEAMATLKADGTFDAIVAYYIDGDEEVERYQSPEDVDRSNGTLVMATNAEFPPYEMREGEEIVGLDVDFAQAIADLLGMELTVEDMAFDSIIMAVQSGKADFGAAGMTVSPDREKEISFTDSYYTGRQVIIVKE